MQHKGRIHWQIVLGCFLLDIFVSMIIGVMFSVIDPVSQRTSAFASSTGIIAWMLGLSSTVFAGWLSGRLAKHDRFLHGFLVGGLGIIFALFLSFSDVPFRLEDVILPLLAAPLAGVAGYLSGWTPARLRKR